MNLVIGSAFRNSAIRGQVQTYFKQVDRLASLAHEQGHTLRVIAVEGDSTDDTRRELLLYADAIDVALQLVTRNHGQRVFASTEEPERMKALSWVGNGILESVLPSDDVLFYVESDLLWRPQTFFNLMHLLTPRRMDVVAPLVFAGDAFYDIWGFRKDGDRFHGASPYHHSLKLSEPTEIDSAGSCLVMRAEVARTTRIPDGEALVGFCRIAREQGYRVWVDARERITHP